ncbi:hypothetical protein AB6G04_11770 [Proteus mirabilis]
MARFNQIEPNISVNIDDMSSHKMEEKLLMGELDVAFSQ